MAGKVKVKINRGSVTALLRSPAIQADLDRRAQRIAAAAGDGNVVEPSTTPNRARSVVITDTHEARLREARSRSLTGAVDAGR